MTTEQTAALKGFCERSNVPFDPSQFFPRFDLPAGYVAGWVGSIYAGCAPDGAIST